MRTVQVLGAVAALVVATGVGAAVAGTHPANVSACVNSHGKIVPAAGKHCPKGTHSAALPTTAAPARLPAVMPAGTTLTGVWQVSGPVTAATPTAARGVVCIYVASSVHVSALTTFSPITNVIDTATKYGWGLYATSSSTGNLISNGTWAATA